MATFGYTLMCEQTGPKQLVADAQRAEEAGFEYAVISDHYSPWLESQGHSPYAWSVLGAVAHVTSRMGLMSFVTCPIRRYHPAVVAQKAATVGVMSDGRFTLGLGAGENLNEHVVGAWPQAQQRHDMLVEALEVIRPLLDGQTLSYSGEHFQVPEAKLYDLPADRVPIALAVSGPSSCEIAGEYADAMIATESKPNLGKLFDEAGGLGKPRYTQVPVCYGPDEETCRKIIHEQWRWSGLTWPVMSQLSNTTAFEHATQTVRPEDVAESVSCGPDLDAHVRGVKKFLDAGFTHVALVQVGGEGQSTFLTWAEEELLPALRSL